MDNKNQKDISNLEFYKSNLPDEYKLLAQKLKSIKKIIKRLETNFLEKEI